MKKNFEEIGTDIGNLVEIKNAAYGSSFAKAGEYLRILYPDGLSPAQYDDALLLVRDFDKSMRIATDRDALGENPWSDKAGYAILGVHMHQAEKEGRETWQGSARVDAGQPSTAQGDSAAQPAVEPTTGNAKSSSARSSIAPSPQPCSSTSALRGASAPTATAAASSEEVGHENLNIGIRHAFSFEDQSIEVWEYRNFFLRCARCAGYMEVKSIRLVVDSQYFWFCSEDCKLKAMICLNLIPGAKP